MGLIKEIFKKANEYKDKIVLGSKFEDKHDSKKMTGEFFINLKHRDGTEENYNIKNIIVDSASLLIARLLADGQTAVDPAGPQHGVRVLAVGTGLSSWDTAGTPAPTASQIKLQAELARKRFSNVTFMKTDNSGLPANSVTNIIDFQTVFSESEAVGAIRELALFGGGYSGEDIDTVANSGTMINYRTLQVINKSNSTTMSIIFRLTT